jgi:acyl carrier protein phosphodiesterase
MVYYAGMFGKPPKFSKVCSMNYLAHAWLSFHEPEITVGNMISDFVKGKKQFEFPAGIQRGIRLHRAIDQFTDSHIATRQLKEFFRPHYRLYSGAFADVVYDHFLANDKNEFPSMEALKAFSFGTYQTLDKHFSLLPAGFQKLFPYMRSQDWLFNYREKWLLGVATQGHLPGRIRHGLFDIQCKYRSDAFLLRRFFPRTEKFCHSYITGITKWVIPLSLKKFLYEKTVVYRYDRKLFFCDRICTIKISTAG